MATALVAVVTGVEGAPPAASPPAWLSRWNASDVDANGVVHTLWPSASSSEEGVRVHDGGGPSEGRDSSLPPHPAGEARAQPWQNAPASTASSSGTWLRQVAFLTDENRRLKAEVSDLHSTLQSQSVATATERARVLQLELDTAQERRLMAQAEVARMAEEASRAAAMARALEVERATAADATESARASLADRRATAEAEAQAWEHRRAAAEAEAVAAAARHGVTQLELDRAQVELKVQHDRLMEATQWRAGKEAEVAAAAAEVEAATQRRMAEEAVAAAATAAMDKARVEVEGGLALEQMRRAVTVELDAAARTRQQDALAAESAAWAARDAARLKAEEASAQVRQEMRARTEAQLLQLKHEMDMNATSARVLLEWQGRMREERENEDVRARAAAAAAAAEVERLRAVIAAVSQQVQHVGTALLSGGRWRVVVVACLATYACWLVLKVTAAAVHTMLRHHLGMTLPALVRDTSRPSGMTAPLVEGCRRAAAWGSRMCGWGGSKATAAWLDGILLPQSIGQQVRDLMATIQYSRLHGLPLRHAMLHGPPGTGKTLLAQRLARVCGMEYAIISGGDVAPLREAAVTELNTLLHWARATPAGMVLFIDEAEAFLHHRHDGMASNVGAAARLNVMSTLLHHTGQPCRRLMLILATNRPGDLDDAVLDRIDVHLRLDLPDAATRSAMCRLFFHRHVASLCGHPTLPPQQPLPTTTPRGGAEGQLEQGGGVLTLDPALTLSVLDAVAAMMDGASGRQLDKLFIAVQARAFSSAVPGGPPPTVTAHMVLACARELRRRVLHRPRTHVDLATGAAAAVAGHA